MDKNTVLSKINALNKDTLMESLGITFTDIADGYIEAVMPVNKKNHQPAGMLHGGATAALAETLAGAGSSLIIDREKQAAVGIEINANHLKGVKSGIVTGKAQIEHRGNTTHVWSIEVFDEHQNKIAICRLTNMIIKKK